MTLIAVVFLSYLLGSIPFGVVLTRLAGLGDIRTIGSGNIGATNVLRTGKKGLALLTMLLDGGKGAAAIVVARHFVPGSDLYAATAVLAGHLFPVWLKFKGGKGVATAAGIATALSWPVGVAALATWVLVLVVTGYSSLAALIALALAPIYALIFGSDVPHMPLFLLGIAVPIYWRHRENIRRLQQGTEGKISLSKKTHDKPTLH